MAGQIIKRGDKTWVVRVFMGRDGTGKRRYMNKTIRGTKKEADTYLSKTLTAISAGTFVEACFLTLGEYLDKWLNAAAKPRVSERTFADYSEVLERYVRAKLGSTKLSHLRPLEIQALYSDMQERGLSARTVRGTHVVLSSALKQAVRWRMLTVNPAQSVELPKRTRREMKALSPSEVTAFLEEAKKDVHGLIFAFAVATGMRPEEYLGLQWKDVDLQKGTATVQRTLCWRRQKGGGWYFGQPKTAQSRRTVPLPASIVRELARYKARQAEARLKLGAEYLGLDLVFATDVGGPLHSENLATRNFKAIRERAKLPASVTPYTLRHTCATLLLLAGENPKVVCELGP
ncbi:MAG: site-specific integrase [Pyrinomonadaceae bacterium]|nr:site-specific integrase [Pyrinomonadaceae bacterium]